MSAAVLAGLGGALAVAAAWDLLGVVLTTPARRGLRSLLAPVRLALSGREPQIAQRRRLTLVSTLTFAAAGHLVAGILLAAVAAALTPLLIAQVLRFSRERWRSELGRGGAPAARAVADAMSGGHSTLAAISGAATAGGIPGVAGRELQGVARRLALGVDQDRALADLARRVAHPTWDAIAAAIALQRFTGGDLARLLRGIAEAADERERVDADARALTSQARFTAKLVAGMPVAGFAGLIVLAPATSLAMLSSPVSIGLLIVASTLLIASFLLIALIARPLR